MNSEDVRNDPRMKAHWNKLARDRVAELEAERDRWKAEALAWRKRAKYDGSKGEFNAIKMSDAEAIVAWLRATHNLPKG